MTHRENSAIMQAGYHILQQATYICTDQKAEACHCPQLPNMKQHGFLEQVHKISFDYPLTISIDVYRIISPASAYVKKMATAIPLLTNWGSATAIRFHVWQSFQDFLSDGKGTGRGHRRRDWGSRRPTWDLGAKPNWQRDILFASLLWVSMGFITK